MPAAYSTDLRSRVVDAVLCGASVRDAAQQFGVWGIPKPRVQFGTETAEEGRRATSSRVKTDPMALDDRIALVEPETRGDPESPLRWTPKSLRNLARALPEMGHKVGRTLVSKLLHQRAICR